MDKKPVTCKKCGRNDLQWKQSAKGKWYLTYHEGVGVNGSLGRSIKTIYPMHECLVRDGELTERRANFILCGLITTTPEEKAEARELMERLEKGVK